MRVGRASELERELASAEQAHGTRAPVHGELRCPFERRQRDLATAAKPCSLGGRVQRLRDILVRPRCRGGPVPDGAVGLVVERLRELSVRLPALLRSRRLRHRRPNEGMPEPEPAMVDGPDPGGHRGRPARVARRLGKLAVRQRREQEEAARLRVEIGEPRRERLLEARR